MENMNESLNERMRNDEIQLFKHEPRVNVISKETYEERIQKVFELIWKTLAKSFGPYGAPTLIYNYPYSHVTKDGFTIMKNLSMDCSDQLVDQAIMNMASDICGRLNYAVGDGTTSAVIATNSIYQSYLKHKNELLSRMVLPRDILAAFNVIKSNIIENLHEYVQTIPRDNRDDLFNAIYNVVYISSNGDSMLSKFIASMYAELQFPGIICEDAEDGVTKMRMVNGYRFDMALTDRLYINSDDQTLKFETADIIIFSAKVTTTVYENILKPLSEMCEQRKRMLIVAASSYDEVALSQTIRRDLSNEWKKKQKVNMVLCTYTAISDHTRALANDFATLCDTVIIDRALLNSIMEQLESGNKIWEIFNIDDRDDTIPMLGKIGIDEHGACLYYGSEEENGVSDKAFKPLDNAIRLGYVGNGSIGLKNSIFQKFYYDKTKYAAVLDEAKANMEELEDRYKKLGTYTTVVGQAQRRYHSLKLLMGVIEVGGESDLSRKMNRDCVDDAIRAAESAFNHGVVLGCNVHLIRAIDDTKRLYLETSSDGAEFKRVVTTLIDILREGFVDVYRTVLTNSYPDAVMLTASQVKQNDMRLLVGAIKENITGYLAGKQIFDEFSFGKDMAEWIKNASKDGKKDVTLYDIIIEYSVKNHVVYDVSKRAFTSTVINSSQTDEEILLATIDLIGLLMTGNQMVVTQKHNF